MSRSDRIKLVPVRGQSEVPWKNEAPLRQEKQKGDRARDRDKHNRQNRREKKIKMLTIHYSQQD